MKERRWNDVPMPFPTQYGEPAKPVGFFEKNKAPTKKKDFW